MSSTVKEVMNRVRDGIREYGWYAFHIQSDQNKSCFSYTMGLTESYAHAELIVMGLPPDSAHSIMVDLVEKIKKERCLKLNEPISEIATYPLVLRAVPQLVANEHASGDNYLYGPNRYVLWQIVWPDKKGLFPWDEGFDTHFDRMQPHLWESPVGSSTI